MVRPWPGVARSDSLKQSVRYGSDKHLAGEDRDCSARRPAPARSRRKPHTNGGTGFQRALDNNGNLLCWALSEGVRFGEVARFGCGRKIAWRGEPLPKPSSWHYHAMASRGRIVLYDLFICSCYLLHAVKHLRLAASRVESRNSIAKGAGTSFLWGEPSVPA